MECMYCKTCHETIVEHNNWQTEFNKRKEFDLPAYKYSYSV